MTEVEQYGMDVVRDVADFLFTKSQENLIEEGAVDTSNLLISGEIVEKSNFIIVGYDAPYAADINDGTDPHFVSHKDLMGWVKRKINPGNEQRIEAVAIAIAKSIGKRGTKPQPYMDLAIAQTEAKFNLI